MNNIEQRLLNDYQRHFPLDPTPYSQIAQELETDTKAVLDLLSELKIRGKVSRVGPIFKPNIIGASTLAAMSIPGDKLTRIAALVNRFPEVNHNYEREHNFNLWFVVVASDQEKLNIVLKEIEKTCGYKVMSLPLLKEFHIDLGFNMAANCKKKSYRNNHQKFDPGYNHKNDQQLIAAIQTGLPLTERPYFTISEQLGISEQTVIRKISDLQTAGIIRRFGIVVRHHELGYRANAMVVWNVPGDRVNELGMQFSKEDCVTLCYQRPRIQPRWPYNLFSMIHGKSRDEVLECLDKLVINLGLNDIPFEILFSLRRFKQRGAKYFSTKELVS